MSQIREKTIPIEDEMRSSYINYAMSVIVSRALPDVRDGLKPVQRRIITTLRDLNLTPGRPYRKCAKVVGDVSGNYHPHGDQSVYPALVRMAQDFSLRYRLVDGQGNFGSVDGDPPAAMRYTEARMTSASQEMMRDIEKDTVDFRRNYDNTTNEPVVLPSALPNLLINGSTGIAVGMATNIPSHNVCEVIDAVVALIENPQIEIKELMKFVKGPDFPTGAIIVGRGGISSAYESGRGIITLRARASIEKLTRGGERERIIITEIPYQVNKSNLIKETAALVRDKKLAGVSDIRDESDKDGMRIVIELRRDEDARIILNQLYKHTQMQTSFGIIMLALVNGKPQVLNLKQILSCYLNHRREVIRRRTAYELRVAEKRAHILEGLKIALDHLDAIIKTIRSSKTVDEARRQLMKKFKLSEIQAQAILDMRLQRLTALEREKLNNEYLELIKLIEKLKQILASEKNLLNIIKEELLSARNKFGDGRRTEIIDKVEELSIEDLIAEEEMIITMSHAGYIKRLPTTTYRQQRRGGRGIAAADIKQDDFIEHLFVASTHQYILFFTDKGQVYWLKVYDIPVGGRLSRGKAIPNLLQTNPGEKITAYLTVRGFDDKHSVSMITERGVAKRTNLIQYSRPRAGGIIAISLDEGDRLIDVKLTDGNGELLIATRNGKAVHFKESGVRMVGRASRGVKGISLGEDDKVVGMEISDERATVLTATSNGYGKRTSFSDYRLQSRGGKGIINIKASERNGFVVGLKAVFPDDEIMLITAKGVIIRTSVNSIKVISRNTQGVRLINLDKGDNLVAVARVVSKEGDEEGGKS